MNEAGFQTFLVFMVSLLLVGVSLAFLMWQNSKDDF